MTVRCGVGNAVPQRQAHLALPLKFLEVDILPGLGSQHSNRMNPNPLGLLAAVLSLAAFALAHAQLRPRPLRLRIIAFAVLAGLAVPALMVGLYYLHVLPEKVWLYEMRSQAGSEFLAIFLGSAAGALAACLPRQMLTLCLFATVGLTAVPYLKPFIAPLDEGMLEDRWHGNACLQSTASTCGPASVCTILKHLGAQSTERIIAHAAHSYAGGTEAWYLARHLRQQGYTARFEFWKTFTPSAGLPAVVGVKLGGAGHFIAVLDVKDGQVLYADPLHGEHRLPLDQFLAHYRFTGFHLVIGKV